MHNVAILCAKMIQTSIESLNTVINLLNSINKSKYNVDVVLIDNLISAHAKMSEAQFALEPCYRPFRDIENHSVVRNIVNLESMSLDQLRNMYDVAIVAIYNIYGEDGRLIGLLETAGIPYMSPSLKTSALCFDKSLTKKILTASGISVPAGFEKHKEDINIHAIDDLIKHSIKYPAIVKASYSGASKGVNIVENIHNLRNAIDQALEFSDEVIFERLLNGNEFTVGIIGHYTNAYALPVVMIKTENKFFDYEAKYTYGKSEEICPAPISKKLTTEIQNIAIESYKAVKANSHSRIDIVYSEQVLYVLEINTFPGLTKESIFPKELAATGISLHTFINNRLDLLINEHVH